MLDPSKVPKHLAPAQSAAIHGYMPRVTEEPASLSGAPRQAPREPYHFANVSCCWRCNKIPILKLGHLASEKRYVATPSQVPCSSRSLWRAQNLFAWWPFSPAVLEEIYTVFGDGVWLLSTQTRHDTLQKRRLCAGFGREKAHSGAACSWLEMLNMRRTFLHLLRREALVVKSNVNRGFKSPVRVGQMPEHLPTRSSCADCNS